MNAVVALLVGTAALFAERATRQVRRATLLQRVSGPVDAGVDAGVEVAPQVAPHAGPHDGSLNSWALGSASRAPLGLWVLLAASAGFALRGPWFGLAAGAGAWVGSVYRGPAREARTAARRDEQLADAVAAMASALRAGQSVSQAIAFAETESARPLRTSLETMNRALDLGEPLDQALDGWSGEVDTDDSRLVAGVLQLHRRSGGDLPSVLDQVAGTLRERQAANREVRALTAQARLSGVILGILPVGFFAFLLLTSRDQIEGAFRTPAGIAALSVGVLLEAGAFAWIRKLLEVR